MPKRRILWFPSRGIDKTLPKVGESTSALQRGDVVTSCYAASNLAVYNDVKLVTRRDLKAYNGTDYGTVYALKKFNRGLAVAGSSGIYIDASLKKSVTLSGIAYLAPWYDSLYYSTGAAMGYIDDDDTDYALGVDAPTSSGAGNYFSIYSSFGTNGSWDATTNTLSAAAFDFLSTVTAGEYIQIYGVSDSRCFTGTVASITSNTELVVTVDPNETEAPTDAGANITFYISPNRWKTYQAYLTEGPEGYDSINTYPVMLLYKVRFYRSGDGARSNTVTQKSFITSGIFENHHIVNTLVGGVRVASIDSSSDDTNVDKVEIFRRDLSFTTSDLYRLVGTVDIGTTTYDDTTAMSSSLTALDDDNKYPCPYTLSNLCFYASRLWGTYRNRVYYSEAFITEARFGYFGPIGENYFEFNDTVKAIIPNQRSLMMFLERETWVLEGTDPDAMIQRIVNEDIGTYSATSVELFGGLVYTVSADYKFYAINGPQWQEIPQISAVLTTSPSYYELRGSDNALWISSGSVVHKYDLSNQDLWTYAINGRLGTGSHTTYLGYSGRVYELDAVGGSETTPASYVESPEIYIGDSTGKRGMLNRLFFRGSVPTATVTVYIDGVTWKSMTVNAPTEQNVILHFYPARGYYAKIRIDAPVYNELSINSSIILNPW